jgi:hypothetical protein
MAIPIPPVVFTEITEVRDGVYEGTTAYCKKTMSHFNGASGFRYVEDGEEKLAYCLSVRGEDGTACKCGSCQGIRIVFVKTPWGAEPGFREHCLAIVKSTERPLHGEITMLEDMIRGLEKRAERLEEKARAYKHELLFTRIMFACASTVALACYFSSFY